MESPIIAAIATPAGAGGIAIVRLSGEGTWSFIETLFRPHHPFDWERATGFSMHYGEIVFEDTVYDEVLLALMKRNASYTREEMAEIHCHGGILVARRILSLLIERGATMAERGEFTKRAFLSGRLTLAQAEAVRETIGAQSTRDLDFSLRRLEDKQNHSFLDVREQLLHLIATAEAAIDFPEDDLDDVTSNQIIRAAEEILALVKREIAKAERGKLYREGLRTAILGRTNVGKSSLLNAMLQEERAIVTAIPGTTRDTIEESIVLGDIPLHLIDTAGIRDTTDPVESVGVDRSRRVASDCDLVLFVFDGHEGLLSEDVDILRGIGDKHIIAIANKADLPSAENLESYASYVAPHPLVALSAKEGTGLDALRASIEDMFFEGNLVIGDHEWVGNMRHRESFLRAQTALESVLTAAKRGMPLDFQVIDLYAAVKAFGEIGGEDFTEEILDRIFSEFCIGK